MFLLDSTVVYSATDLANAATCEFATLRALDVKLGLATAVVVADAMLSRTAELGDAHELRVLAGYVTAHGTHVDGTSGGVVEVDARHGYDEVTLRAKCDETLAALRAGADVVFQGSFFDGRFHGRSDFLVRIDDSYAVYDTKLAKHAKITALLQLAAYADQLQRHGIAVHGDVTLILGDGAESVHAVDDLIPVYLERRARLEQILDEHHSSPDPVAWNDPRYLACGRCDVCAAEVDAHRDLLLVANLRVTQRARLRAAGIETIEDLATSTGAVDGVPLATLERLRTQARLQVAQDERPLLADGRPDVHAEVFDTAPLAVLPLPDAGDIFFDFEGDPLWAENGSADWGLEYLFGVVEAGTETFVAFWAHDRREEKAALLDFLAYVKERRTLHPSMHIYHYAAYEKTALLRLVGRHGVGEEEVDDLLRAGVFVDLYSTVRQSIRVSQPSYSIKKLEPLYMGADLRDGVTNAADSVAEYARACHARDSGDADTFADVLASIADYNHYDCRSTLRLRDWLRETAAAAGVTWVGDLAVVPDEPVLSEPDPLELDLLELAGDIPRGERTADQQAYSMLAAALGYHRREHKPFWWAHFARLREPLDDWSGTRDVFTVDSAVVTAGWGKEGKQRSLRRTVELTGEWGSGSSTDAGKVFVVHDSPVPTGMEVPEGGLRGCCGGEVVERSVDELGRDVITIEEMLAKGVDEYSHLPLALTPQGPPPTQNIEAAIREVAQAAIDSSFPHQPGLDVLRRRRPRTSTGALPAVGAGTDGNLEAITSAVLGLDNSYVAVQGPPGTGKTYVGSHVVRRLVAQGWRIGVTAQSHAVVENFLDAVVKAGVPSELVGKERKQPGTPTWTDLGSADKLARFLDEHPNGCVVGGTAWDLTNLKRIGRGQLDLVVIDEAGQFSLANTLAVSVATTRLLLLGDPQQLPQVSQGTHPEPVDGSALGWLNEGHATLPASRGYFLQRSWRMHPTLCDRVSRLAYDGLLHAQEPETTSRVLVGLDAGLHVVRIDHSGNSVESPEEVAEVVAQIRRLLECTWSDPEEKVGTRGMTQRDVLVVAAYNAQVALLRRELKAAGLSDVRVGTVDKFQGQEAPVVIVSMAASSSADVPRGMEFLLSRNRVNVAVSRGQWAAIVVRSPHLTDYLPGTPAALAELGAFIRLTS